MNYSRPVWQSVLLYLVIGLFAYGAFYFFILAPSNSSAVIPITTQTETPIETPTTGPYLVTLTSEGFSPTTLTIKSGNIVTWTNRSGVIATVSSDPHPAHTTYPPLNLDRFADGDSLTLIFAQPGTYSYHNHLIPSQQGTVVVE